MGFSTAAVPAGNAHMAHAGMLRHGTSIFLPPQDTAQPPSVFGAVAKALARRNIVSAMSGVER